MSFWRKEKENQENQIDALTQLQNELEADRLAEQADALEETPELSLEERLMLEAEEEIEVEKQSEKVDHVDGGAVLREPTDAMDRSEAVMTAEIMDSADNVVIAEDSVDVSGDVEISAKEDAGEAFCEDTDEAAVETPLSSEASSKEPEIKTFRIPRWVYGLLLAVVGVFLIVWGVSRFSEPADVEEETEPENRLAMVSADYSPELSLNIDEKTSALPTSYEQMVDDMRGWVCEFGRINIRDKASFDGEVVNYVVYGDRLKIYEQEGEFTRVKYFSPITGEMTEGYCYTEYISDTEPEGAQVYLNVPLYKQADYRWGAVKIGSYETLASAGCTTTCISMVESYMTGEDVYPDDVVKMLYYTYDGRLVFPDYYTHHWARDYMSVALQKLHDGIPVLVSGYNAAGGTHWVVLVAYKGDGEDFSSDLFLINDPGSPRYTLTDFMRDYPFIEKIVYYNK